jgi:hypothetical protein
VGCCSLDSHQHQFTLRFVASTLGLSLATGHANLRLIALAPNLLSAMCGPQFLVSCPCYRLGCRIPFAFASQPKRSIPPPGLFTVVEDMVAVDGRGGLAFLAAWLRRYQISPRCMNMMWRLPGFWGVGCLLCVALTAVRVFTIQSKYMAFGFGWTAPFV